MAWLLVDGKVVAAAEIADSIIKRTVGLLGKENIEGVMAFPHTKGVHTFGMKFAIDVAFLNKEMKIIALKSLDPNRFAIPSMKTKMLLEARQGSFERWNVGIGSLIEIVKHD